MVYAGSRGRDAGRARADCADGDADCDDRKVAASRHAHDGNRAPAGRAVACERRRDVEHLEGPEDVFEPGTELVLEVGAAAPHEVYWLASQLVAAAHHQHVLLATGHTHHIAPNDMQQGMHAGARARTPELAPAIVSSREQAGVRGHDGNVLMAKGHLHDLPVEPHVEPLHQLQRAKLHLVLHVQQQVGGEGVFGFANTLKLGLALVVRAYTYDSEVRAAPGHKYSKVKISLLGHQRKDADEGIVGPLLLAPGM